jgi:hypothetical protein
VSPWRPWEKFTRPREDPGRDSVLGAMMPGETVIFSQGKRPPAFAPRHRYGMQGTIHQTGTIDIQQDEGGNVTAVWFRCLNLPFTCSAAESGTTINPVRDIAIEEITYADLREVE